MFSLLLLSIETQNTIAMFAIPLLASIYHNLAKLEQNRMIRTIENYFELFDKKSFNMLTLTVITVLLAPFWNNLMMMKYLMQDFNFRYSSIILVWDVKPGWNKVVNMKDLTCLLATVVPLKWFILT